MVSMCELAAVACMVWLAGDGATFQPGKVHRWIVDQCVRGWVYRCTGAGMRGVRLSIPTDCRLSVVRRGYCHPPCVPCYHFRDIATWLHRYTTRVPPVHSLRPLPHHTSIQPMDAHAGPDLHCTERGPMGSDKRCGIAFARPCNAHSTVCSCSATSNQAREGSSVLAPSVAFVVAWSIAQ